MSDDPQKNEDEAKFNETLKRMLKTPPTPHKPSDTRQPSEAMRVEKATRDKK